MKRPSEWINSKCWNQMKCSVMFPVFTWFYLIYVTMTAMMMMMMMMTVIWFLNYWRSGGWFRRGLDVFIAANDAEDSSARPADFPRLQGCCPPCAASKWRPSLPSARLSPSLAPTISNSADFNNNVFICLVITGRHHASRTSLHWWVSIDDVPVLPRRRLLVDGYYDLSSIQPSKPLSMSLVVKWWNTMMESQFFSFTFLILSNLHVDLRLDQSTWINSIIYF